MRTIRTTAGPKRSGTFYTPARVADALCAWAIRGKDDQVLDPSFGGCAFLAAAAQRLGILGARRPVENLRGCDTDKRALEPLRQLLGAYPAASLKVPYDFLTLTPGDTTCPPVHAVVGNPPYVRHHLLKGHRRSIAHAAIKKGGGDLSLKSSYWAYFVLHSVRFLKPGGRLAFVLPMSLLTSDYADAVRQVLFRGFGRTRVVVVDKRLFSGAEERSVVVLADDWTAPNRGVSIERALNAEDLAKVIARPPQRWNGRALLSDRNAWRRELVANDALQLAGLARNNPFVRQLGDIADISLGIVTGANDYFVLPTHRMNEIRALGRQRQPVLTGSRHVGGISADRRAFKEVSAQDKSCELLLLRDGDGRTAVGGYLRTNDARRAKASYKCQVREPWFVLRDRARPDAFLTPLCGPYPRLILNNWRFDSTNTLYRVAWKNRMPEAQAKLTAMSLVSSLGTLSAELVGRVYSGGALKLEPRDARRVLVAVCSSCPSDVGEHFERVDALLSENKWAEAQSLADEFVLERALGLKKGMVGKINRAALALRSLRQAK